jgi:hypothetical protein
MTRSPLLDDADFEAEVRGMLDRRAADVTPARPRVPAEVVLDGGRRSARPPARRRTWAAVAAAAAAAAVVVVAGLIATVGGGSGRDRATTADESSGGGAPGYPPLVVWPVVGDDALTGLVADPGDLAGTLAAPGTAAAAYLAEVAPAATADPTGAVLGPTGDTATVPWTFSDDGAPPAFTGTVHLRDAGTAGSPLWVVVGAETEGVSVGDFRGEANSLQFTVAVSGPLADSNLSVRVGVDGGYVSVAGDPLPQGAPDPDLSSGEIVAPGEDGRMTFLVPAGGDADVEILVRAVGGTFLTTSHVGLALPAAPVAPAPAPESPGAAGPAPPAAAPVDDPAPAPDVPGAVQVSGTFQGMATYTVSTGDCDLDHVLDSTFTLTDGTTWSVHATYCGVFESTDRWRGTGVFTAIVSPTGDTLTGRLVSSAALPTDGEPYTLDITGGTGAYDGATGTCTLDNHLVETGAGTQSQSGDFACAITP